ncbi:MAG TPA: adenylate/guanylate cyclase domain-containing protein [Kofleriaceae bacterium]
MRLRTTLTVAIVVLIISTVVLVAGSGYVTSRRSAAELTNDVLAQATARVSQTVRAQLDLAEQESVELASKLAVIEDKSSSEVAALAMRALEAHPTLTFVSFGSDGLVEAMRLHDGRAQLRVLSRDESGTDFRLVDILDGQVVNTAEHKAANQPKLQPYFHAAMAAPGPIWTETYPFFGEGTEKVTRGVTRATKVGDGVLTVDFDLRGTSQFLQGLELFAHGEAFVVEYRSDGTRAVIAHPQAELLGTTDATSVEKIADPRVAAFARSLPATRPAPGAMVSVAFDSGGDHYIGGFRALDGVPWVVCALAPEDDVLGPVHANDRISLVIILVATIGALGLAWWIGAGISRPLRKLADETQRIGTFELGDRPLPSSRIVEVARLTAAVDGMKRNLRSFKKYVPADVVRELVAQGAEANLGGKRETLTIHFSDIAGFTTLAEQTPPEQLVAMLGEYLDEMTRPILASGGTVDKFIGDAVMAFWGAPRADAAHALHACEAALANRDRLAALNAQWAAAGRPRLEARVGLHTGEVIVGNIGSPDRLEYTVIGDDVNLASRLEALNKRYGTSLLISETTYALVREQMVARPIDRVAVKGKALAVTIYELLGRRGTASSDALGTAHEAAFAHYLARRFAEAAAALRALPADQPTRMLLARCEQYAAAPPPADWDGAERLTEK